MDYVITNPTKKLFIRLNQNGSPETCGEQMAQRFESSKARNIVDHLPKTMKKFNFYVEPIPEIIQAEQREKELIKELENSDKEMLDLLHIIEIEKPKDLFNGWKLYKQIKANRIKRREIKDEILIVENVLENIKNVSCMHRDQVQKSINGLFGRKYKFRIIEEGDENAIL